MIGCQFCSTQESTHYIYTQCQHFICTACAFEQANFSEQSIRCCDQETFLEEESMSVIIKSRRIRNKSPKNQQNHPMPPKEKKQHQEQKQTNYMNKRDKQNNRSAEKRQVLEKILMEQIERIREEFAKEHEKLRNQEEALVQQAIKAYEQQVETILEHPTNEIVTFKDIKNEKCSRQNLLNSENDNRQKMRIKENEDRMMEQMTRKRSEEEFDYILKRLQMNQERMNEKLRKHGGMESRQLVL